MKRELEEIAEIAAEIEAAMNVDWVKVCRNDTDEMNKLARMIGSVRAKAGIIATRAKVAVMTDEELRNALADLASVGSKS